STAGPYCTTHHVERCSGPECAEALTEGATALCPQCVSAALRNGVAGSKLPVQLTQERRIALALVIGAADEMEPHPHGCHIPQHGARHSGRLATDHAYRLHAQRPAGGRECIKMV